MCVCVCAYVCVCVLVYVCVTHMHNHSHSHALHFTTALLRTAAESQALDTHASSFQAFLGFFDSCARHTEQVCE
jgi:hypothetical protein